MKNQNVARAAQLENIVKKEIPMEIQICHEISNGFAEILKEIRKQEKQVINSYSEK
jgi:hypothetical protein